MRERRLHLAVLVLLVLALVLAGAPAAQAKGKPHGPRATIRWTDHGIPRILARSWKGLGYGYGYALASQNICTIADSYVTVDAQRSRFFGPDKSWKFAGNGFTFNNLDSDFFFQKINDEETVEKLLKLAPPLGPKPEIAQIAR